MERMIIFGDANSFITTTLLVPALQAIFRHDPCAVVTLCDASRSSSVSKLPRNLRMAAAALSRKIFNPRWRLLLKPTMLTDIHRIAADHRLPVLLPPDRSINDPRFVERLRIEHRPTLALFLGCLQIVKPPLLSLFERAANYHNGLLPGYAGLHATGWSLYHQEPFSGYTFHLMSPGIDDGPVLLQGRLAIRPAEDGLNLDHRKLLSAARQMDKLVALLFARDAGRPQVGPASYFSHTDHRRITTIADPTGLTYDELQRRLRAFDILTMHIGGRWQRVSALTTRRGGPQSFTTADGVRARPIRLAYKPQFVNRCLERWFSRRTLSTGISENRGS
jgi:methionyl-tRNA formyltransferase